MADEGGGGIGSILGAMFGAVTAMLRPVGGLVGGAYDLFRQPAVQGSAEVANALFTGSAYVPYGDGQRSAGVPAPEAAAQPVQAPDAPAADPPSLADAMGATAEGPRAAKPAQKGTGMGM